MNDSKSISKSLARIDIAKALRVFLCYCLALFIFASSHTLANIIPPAGIVLLVCITTTTVLLTIVAWSEGEISNSWMRNWAFWIAIVIVVYGTVAITTRRFGDTSLKYWFALVCLLPLLLASLNIKKERDTLLRAFCNIVFVFAIVSLILWILGPVLNLIQPNCTIENHWGSSAASALYRTTPGYFHLLYIAQTEQFANIPLMRNTGIFPESPMYVFALGVALFFEAFIVEKPRKVFIAVYMVTIATAFSTTGFMIILGMFAIWILSALIKRRLWILAVIIVVVGAVAIGWVAVTKIQTSNSGAVHIDDFVAGFQAWLDSPIVGNGFMNIDAVRAYMGEFRITNIGVSNSLAIVLATGGLVFFSIHVIAFSGYFVRSSTKEKLGGLCLFCLWAVTAIHRLPLAALVLAIGVSMLCESAFKKKDEEHLVKDERGKRSRGSQAETM